MMLDTVGEEDLVTRAAGMPFDRVLGLIDAVNQADLSAAYDAAADRYMVLAGKGHRSGDEALELDRLDSALRLILGESGLLAFAAHLFEIMDSAFFGATLFRGETASGTDFYELAGALASAAALCRESFTRTPIPLDAKKLGESLDGSAVASSALARIVSDNGIFSRITYKRRAARAVGMLTDSLLAQKAKNAAWVGFGLLVDPRQTSARERHARVGLVFRLGGLAGCLRAVRLTGDAFAKTAELVKGALGV
jgi:hypothetical protein